MTVEGKLLQRIVVWPTYEDAIAAEEDAASEDCKRTNKLTVWQTYEQAAAHTNIGAGGGDDPYVAQAVHFDGTSYLVNEALASGQHNKLSFAVWFRLTVFDMSPIGGFWITDPFAPNFSYGEADYGGGNGGLQFTLVDADQATYLATAKTYGPDTEPLEETWYAYMGSADCSTDLGKIVAYLGDVDSSQDESHPTSNLGGPSAVIQGDGVEMRIGVPDPVPRAPLDMANFMMWYGQAIDWSVEANRRFIIDASGKAVDPALAIAHFGTPTIALIGDATAFQTNQGTGGAFSLSGSLTNASSSPSDGGELPAPPDGFHYLVNADGKYIINADGAYILVDGD